MAGGSKIFAPPPRAPIRDEWRERASLARGAAAHGNPEIREFLLRLAHSYDVLAAHTEPGPSPARLAAQAKAAAQRAALGKRHIARQRALIAMLKRGGHDVGAAEQLLRTFEEAQRLHVDHSERLQREAARARLRAKPKRASRKSPAQTRRSQKGRSPKAAARRPGKAAPGLRRRRGKGNNPA